RIPHAAATDAASLSPHHRATPAAQPPGTVQLLATSKLAPAERLSRGVRSPRPPLAKREGQSTWRPCPLSLHMRDIFRFRSLQRVCYPQGIAIALGLGPSQLGVHVAAGAGL